MDNRPIGVFDSGVGGLSILEEISKLLPAENFVYCADQKNIPYGAKSEAELKVLTEGVVDFLIKQDVKMIVVGCNTATVYTLDHLRAKFSVPIIGIVPVVKTLSEVSQTRKIGVLSTLSTSKSRYLQDLITKFAGDCQVFVSPGIGLVEMVEAGTTTGAVIESALKELLTPMVNDGVDSIALGCSHYPFLKAVIQKIVGEKVQILDSGAAVARQVKRILENNDQLSVAKSADVFFTTGEVASFKTVAEKLLGRDLENVSLAEIN